MNICFRGWTRIVTLHGGPCAVAHRSTMGCTAINGPHKWTKAGRDTPIVCEPLGYFHIFQLKKKGTFQVICRIVFFSHHFLAWLLGGVGVIIFDFLYDSDSFFSFFLFWHIFELDMGNLIFNYHEYFKKNHEYWNNANIMWKMLNFFFHTCQIILK